MRALSLHQPYATLVALGVKNPETRSWATKYRGPLLIHAAKRQPHGVGFVGQWLAQLADTGLGGHEWMLYRAEGEVVERHHLPFGAVVASCVLADCVPTERIWPLPRSDEFDFDWFQPDPTHYPGEPLVLIDQAQLPFGDFSPGMFAWLLEDVKPTTERCPRCWGDPTFRNYVPNGGDAPPRGRPYNANVTCPTCEGAGKCEPVPMRGRQGLWTPTTWDQAADDAFDEREAERRAVEATWPA